jgi:pimeloyl-ACP methyl ester carboxylesterase
VLRIRTVAATALSIPLPVHATQVLFRSTDSHGQPTADVTTVLVPKVPWRGPGVRPVVSYQTAEDGVGSQCAPSYALRAGLAAITSNSELETPILALLVARGWAVVTTDYEGPQSQFLTGRQEGHAVLDGIRAALAVRPNGLSPHAPVAAWGYSGGAFATAWAAALRARYAPQVHLVGIAFGGLPADLEATMRNVDGGYGFGLVFGGFIGLDRAYPEAHLSALLNTRGRAEVVRSGTACTVTLVTRFAFHSLSTYTQSPDPFDTTRLRRVLAADNPKAPRTRTPAYSYHATADELVPVQVENALVAKYCARGDTVQIVRTPGGSHNTELLFAAPGAIRFLAGRLAGEPATDNCPR